MLGRKFSIAAFPLAAAGVCSVLLSSPTTWAQSYQQTQFPSYGGQPAAELSTQATRPPIFSDSPSDSSGMSPDSWGESAISNPYAGYAGTPRVAQANHTFQAQRGMSTPNPSVAQKANDIFGPSTLNLESLPEAKKAPVRVAKADEQSIFETPLTNTQYSRGKAQGSVLANPYTKTAFPKDKTLELMTPPEVPKFDSPLAQVDDVAGFDQIPFDIEPAKAAIRSSTSAQADEPLLLAPPTTTSNPLPVQPRASLQAPSLPPSLSQAAGSSSAGNSGAEISGSLSRNEAPSASQTFQGLRQGDFQDLSRSNGRSQNQLQSQPRNVLNQQSVTQNRQPQFVQPRTVEPQYSQSQFGQSQFAQPQFAQPQQYQQQVQPTYFQSSPHYAQQASGPTSNEWGYGYPESNQGFGQPYVETPTSIFNHGFENPTNPQNIAQRSVQPTTRNQSILDRGESFDFETKKKEYPSFGEIIATGRFFGTAEVALLRPHFLGNTAISIDGPSFSESIPFNFDNETAPHLRFGFESKFGPGFELNYFNINANSESIAQPFDGIAPVTTIASVTGPDRFSQLSADAIGETLIANHSFELETYSFNVFKEVQFKISRINGRFGFTYANIAQALETSVVDNDRNTLESLVSTSDFRGYGPKFGIDYYRPVGHTPLEFITSITGTGLFGRRDQFVENSAGLVERRFGADEFVTVVDFNSGLQYKKTTGENRSWYARVSFNHQSWLGGGTAVDPQGDFGLKGFLFGVGYNR